MHHDFLDCLGTTVTLSQATLSYQIAQFRPSSAHSDMQEGLGGWSCSDSMTALGPYDQHAAYIFGVWDESDCFKL